MFCVVHINYVITERREGGFQMITFDNEGGVVWADGYIIKSFRIFSKFSVLNFG